MYNNKNTAICPIAARGDGYIYDVDYKFLHDYSVELSRISNLLNQIAKRANTTGNLYSEDVKEVKELMQKVWHTHESMLSKQFSCGLLPISVI